MKRYVPRLALGSAAAKDVEWYYQSGPSALGLRAQNVDSSGGGTRAEDVGWQTDRVVNAATKYRQISRGLALLAPGDSAVLRVFYSAERRHFREVEQFFGALVHLVALRVTDADKLARIVHDKKRDLAKKLRDAAEQRLANALDAYAAVRVRPGFDEDPRPEK